MKLKLKVRRINPSASLPEYATSGSAGLDIRSAEDAVIEPGKWKAVKTGIAVEIPPGYEAQLRPRSGLALSGITVLNTPGTIDSDYRGEVKVILINFLDEPLNIRTGDRIAQMVIAKVERVEVEEVKELSKTERGEGGFGSTGTR